MFKKLAMLLTCVLTFTVWQTAQAVPASFQWGSFSASGSTTFGAYDTNATTVLASGDLVQLLWVGANGVIDAPGGNGGAGGDDVLLGSTSVQNSGTLPPPLRDKGYVPLATMTFDSADSYANGTVYLRAWNAATANGATAYGDSATGTLSDGGVLNAARWYVSSAPTAVGMISAETNPLPTSLLLMLSLLLLTGITRRAWLLAK